MIHDNLIFRPASIDDCRTIASLYSISSDGVADYIWSGLAEPGEEIMDVGARRYARENSAFSYTNCLLAEVDGSTAGFLVAFPMHVEPTEPESDPVLAPYSKLEEDNSYYVCGMAMFPEYRGQGIGTRLLDHAERDAKARGYNKLSLIVFEQNVGAKRLYLRQGFREASRQAIHPHPLIHYDGDALLMVKDIGLAD
ncbi:MAG: GNAT family N-acetyltransferase [Gammaproteobacteria bacterium]